MLHAGIDIGGTAIKAGLVDDENMNIVAFRKEKFPAGGFHQVIQKLEQTISDMTAEKALRPDQLGSIGVAVPGSIDPSGQRVIHAHNLGFHNVPIKSEVTKYFPKTPVYIANDADAAALGELHAGAFVDAKTAVLITIGTGVGGGLILNGKMFRGGQGHGVELGHMMLIYGGERCSCGNRGCVEAYCSATWLAEQGKRCVNENRNGIMAGMALDKPENVDAKLVIDAAKQGDASARIIFDTFVDHLSAAITSITALLDPEIIAIGGGVGEAGEFLFEPLRALVGEKSFYKASYKIVPAVLGNKAGLIGASLLHKNRD